MKVYASDLKVDQLIKVGNFITPYIRVNNNLIINSDRFRTFAKPTKNNFSVLKILEIKVIREDYFMNGRMITIKVYGINTHHGWFEINDKEKIELL